MGENDESAYLLCQNQISERRFGCLLTATASGQQMFVENFTDIYPIFARFSRLVKAISISMEARKTKLFRCKTGRGLQ
jgi:hypothetical protein